MLMTNNSTKQYQSYKFKATSTSESREKFEGKGKTADRDYMNEQMKKVLDKFIDKKSIKFQDFYGPIHKFHCKAKEIKDLIIGFQKHLKEEKNIDVLLLKKREMSKANSAEVNILFNSLAVQYPEFLFMFLEDYFLNNYSEKEDTKSLIENLRDIIDQLKCSQNENDSLEMSLFVDSEDTMNSYDSNIEIMYDDNFSIEDNQYDSVFCSFEFDINQGLDFMNN